MRVADKVFEKLEKVTSTVYVVPGGGAMYLVDALGRSRLKYVAAIHEAGAGEMAIGHAMATGELGVCLVTSGPGATNAMTPCLAAWMDSIPVLFISGQAETRSLIGNSGLRTRGFQEADIIKMVKPMTKLAYQPETSAHDCIMALDKMIAECMSGRRGPSWLSVPVDIQGMTYE